MGLCKIQTEPNIIVAIWVKYVQMIFNDLS